MSLKIYNTLSNKKEVFKSIEANKVKMYVCGPTVYDLLHIGNFRGAIFFNLVRNWLEEIGYQVNFVYNYTDVDDKIINRANEKKQDPFELSAHFIKEFEKDFSSLKLKKHDHNPKVTSYLNEIINYVQTLIDNQKAYVIDGEVFYSVKSFEDYGKLSKKKLEDLRAGERVEVDSKKKDPADFVLWKPAKEGEPFWESPWGKGRPGWHIECSAMIKDLLGDSIDIHGGGIDLIFPHHENEIAQGEGACGGVYSKYWMHNNFINMKDEKMSKSLGNVVTARKFMEDYHPEILKYLMLSSHYRSVLNLNEEKIEGSIAALERVYSALELASFSEDNKASEEFKNFVEKANERITHALNDDFNTGEMFAAIFEVVRLFNKQKKKPAKYFLNWIKSKGELCSLFLDDPTQILNEFNKLVLDQKGVDLAQVEQLVQDREAARAQKDWGMADKLRDELGQLGINLIDGNPYRKWGVLRK